MTARSVTRPCSFPNATMLPVKEIAPIRAPRRIVTPATGGTGWPAFANARYSRLETMAAAPPPEPLKSATI